jgi:hypothetical protein
MYSTTDAANNMIGWRRCGENIAYYRNEDNNSYNTRTYNQILIEDYDDEDHNGTCSYTLTYAIFSFLSLPKNQFPVFLT